MEKYIFLKNSIIQNEKLSYFIGKWRFIKYDEIILKKYKYIYDYYTNFFGNDIYYKPVESNDLYYFEFKNINEYILVIFYKLFYDVLKPEIKNLWLSYNIYDTYNNNNNKLSKINDIEKKINKIIFSKNIHWIWFRKNKYKLTNEIVNKIKTWIYLNDDFSFYLWTNITNIIEFNDFISELTDENKKMFDKINIKYNNEIVNIVNLFYKKYINTPEFNTVLELFLSDNSNNIIYKTDYLRYIILYEYGGIYTDFNDCICLTPMKYLLTFIQNKLVFGQDSIPTYNNSDYNNYFISTKKYNSQLLEYLKSSIYFFPQVLRYINDINIIRKNIDNMIEILEKINISKINIQLYEKNYLISFLELTYFDIKIKDNIAIKIKSENIFFKILLKYLKYVSNDIENVNELIFLIENNKQLKHNINIEELKEFLNNRFTNNINDFIFINMQLYLDTIISITNLPFFLSKYKNININTINNCYLYKYMNFTSFIGHLYDSTCLGTDKIYTKLDEELNNILK